MDKSINTAGISSELTYIFELLKDNNTNTRMPELDWELFLNLSLHHRVFPLLHSKVKNLDVPVHVSKFLQVHYQQNIFRMMSLTGEMEKVSEIFSNSKIRTLFLKGPVLAHDLYGDLSLRTSSDLDFLIPIEHLERAEEILVELGYEKDDYIESVLNDWRWRHHHVTYYHPVKQMKLEIHWRLHPGPGKEPSFQELWERRNKSSNTKSPVYLLGKEDLFVFLVAHGARHGWSRLRWLVDIQKIMKQELDWAKVYQLFQKYHNPHVGGQAIILASELLDAEFKEEMTPFVTNTAMKLAQEAIFYLERMVNLHTDPVPEDISSYHASHLFSLMSTQQKAIHLLSLLHPFPEDAQTLPLPKPLHFLYFPLRPVLWAWRKTRKQAVL
ncbi:nucleotidyltransferase family protein [Halalkalibacter alkaliphilus]|uniref:Nucleotidyltransferase family protein n=1 Tax=Halalkalibacter alkaliphilus TaxID=2917993 RepID=A0A9X1ZXD9_9BACI|nr:nucleotidyltransferase family protein [Halalkalibacter alkaliphilus]MCL7746091.1 nucleotidyltransferase family protein [Halalkalibacter alkaliphilus]